MTAKNKMDKYHEKTACHPTRKLIPNSSRRILSPAFSIFSTHLPDFIPNQGGAFKFQMGSSLLHFRLQPGNALFQTIPGFILRYAEGLFIILCVQLQLPLFGTAHRLGDNTVFPVVFS